MINTIIKSFNMDLVYTANSFIYLLRKLPILKDLFTEDIYKNKVFKNIIKIIVFIFTIIKSISFKLIYMIILYSLCLTYCKDNVGIAFAHLFFVLTILGMFINNKLLSSKMSNYLAVVVFNIDADKYFKSNLLYTNITNFIFNFIGLFIISLATNLDITVVITLCITCLFARIIGEVWYLDFYYKHGYLWMTKTVRYFIVCALFIGIGILPYFDFFILRNFMLVCNICLFILSIMSIKYIKNFKYFKQVYKSLNTKTRVMNDSEASAYNRQVYVEVKNKDKDIKSKKIENKHGYDLFNTIFFERHKEILTRSLFRFSIIITGVYLVLIFFIFRGNITNNINDFLLNKLGWFVLIMYFINRGAIITQAMFFNCDHAMLTYNFYREPKVILELFKKRILMLSKLNLIPAVIISIGNCILLYLTGGASITTYVSIFMFVISLSIFFSVHYLVMYYLLQPYNKDLKIKKFSYSVVSLATYLVAFQFTNFIYDSVILGFVTLIFTVIYVIVACLLVNKYSYKTFKING